LLVKRFPDNTEPKHHIDEEFGRFFIFPSDRQRLKRHNISGVKEKIFEIKIFSVIIRPILHLMFFRACATHNGLAPQNSDQNQRTPTTRGNDHPMQHASLAVNNLLIILKTVHNIIKFNDLQTITISQ